MAYIKDNTSYGKSDGFVVDLPVAASTDIDQNDLIGMASGFARVFQSGDQFMGVARESVDNSSGTAGAKTVQVEIGVQEITGVTIEGTAAAGALSTIDLGKPARFVSNGGAGVAPTFTVVESDDDAGDVLGVVTSIDSTTGNVLLTQAASRGLLNEGAWNLTVPLSHAAMLALLSTGTGDVTGAIPLPGSGGSITTVTLGVKVGTASGSKGYTVQPKIGSTALTGGAVAVVSSNLNAITDVKAGTAITSDNNYKAGDTLAVSLSAVTAIPETGEVVLYVEGVSRS